MRRRIIQKIDRSPTFDFLTGLVFAQKYEGVYIDYTGTHIVTPNGSFLFEAGKVGFGLKFLGINDYLDIANHSDFSFVDGGGDLSFSIDFWIKINTFPAPGQWIISKRDDNVNRSEWQVRIDPANKLLTFKVFNLTSATDQLSVKTSASSWGGIWKKVNLTYSIANGQKLYVDGVNIGVDNSTGTYTGMTASSSIIRLGAKGWLGNSGELFSTLDELKVYKNRELTQAEITEMYNKENTGISVL